MSVALMALPDTWLNLCPRLPLKDEDVTQNGERQKETEEKMRTNTNSNTDLKFLSFD